VYGEIARINDCFRDRCGFDPIEVFYTNDRAQAFAAMEMCDALLVNSRQDGMNLVVKEWAVLSRKPGVLVVSETAGVACETGAAALLISALDVEGTAAALGTALDMPAKERGRRIQALRAGVHKWTARDWLAAQLHELGITLPPPAAAHRGVVGTPKTIECELTVTNREGIHARPAAAFVRCAREFESEIEILTGPNTYTAKSILSVMIANLDCGTKFTLRVTGSDAQEAVDRIRALVAGFRDE
jgi:phosphotransferase system HPr (HPr) family protein